MSEVEETLKRINSHKGVQGIVIMNTDAVPIRSTMDPQMATKFSGLIKPLADKARSCVRDLDPQNDLTFLRIRSKKHEILVRALWAGWMAGVLLQRCAWRQEHQRSLASGWSAHGPVPTGNGRCCVLSHASASHALISAALTELLL